MKKLILLLSLFLSIQCIAQNAEETEVKACIDKLFNAMQLGDSAMVRLCFDPSARLQTAKVNPKTKKAILENEHIDSFMVQVNSIKKNHIVIEERVINYDIKIDYPLANVWADYEFYVNEKLSHIGVDAIQLFKSDSGWKIIQICDTKQRK
jgi:hypothetical protein